MLFEDLLPLRCLNVSHWFLLQANRFFVANVGDVKERSAFIADESEDDREDYWNKMQDEFAYALEDWRRSVQDIGLITLPDEVDYDSGNLKTINYVNPRTIIQDYTVRFRISDNRIVDDAALADLCLPSDCSEALHNKNIDTLLEFANADSEVFVLNRRCFSLKMVVYLLVFLRKRCVFEFEPGLKPPLVSQALPEGIGGVAQALFADIYEKNNKIAFDEVVAGLAPLRELVEAKYSSYLFVPHYRSDVDFMKLIFSQPAFIAIAQRTIIEILSERKKGGLAIFDIDMRLPFSMMNAGGSATFLPEMVEKEMVKVRHTRTADVYMCKSR